MLITGHRIRAGDGIRTRGYQLGRLMPYHLATPACGRYFTTGKQEKFFRSDADYWPQNQSGRRDSNPRISAWKADALPLGDSRMRTVFYHRKTGEVFPI